MISQRSLTLSLMAWTLGALLLVWGAFVVLGYRTGVHEADELTDGHLASVALLQLAGQVNPLPIASEVGRKNINTLPGMGELKSHDYQRSMSLVVWDGSGQVLIRRGEAAPVPFTEAEGFETLQLGSPPMAWRVFSRWDGPRRETKVAVLLSLSERDDLAQDIAEQIAEPGFWLLPVVALALGLAIHRGLRPLYNLSQAVDALDITKVEPLQNQGRHEEFRAVVNSINTLASRYQAAVARERDLANEFAHELRTPLASINLQARALRQTLSPAEHERQLQQLERDALRAGQVLSHLLALARASRTEMEEAGQQLDLDAISRREIAEFAQRSARSGHRLGLESSGAFLMSGHPILLALALRNLLENALSHTPAGTLVEVHLNLKERWLQVCDNGPPGAKFVRHSADATDGQEMALGLGLGHRVVSKIAQIHGAQFTQPVASGGFTSCYRLTFVKSGIETV